MASDFFSKFGKKLRTTVGVGVGSMSLSLEKHAFDPGDRIRGTVKLELSEPLEAKRLVVKLTGTQKRKTRDGTSNQTIYNSDRELDGKRTYRNGESFDFELVVPSDADSRPQINDAGVIGDIARVVTFVASAASPVSWRVVAALEVPWARNVSKTTGISVSGG